MIVEPEGERDALLAEYRKKFHNNMLLALSTRFDRSLTITKSPNFVIDSRADELLPLYAGNDSIADRGRRSLLPSSEALSSWIRSPEISNIIGDKNVDFIIVGDFHHVPEQGIILEWRVVKLTRTDGGDELKVIGARDDCDNQAPLRVNVDQSIGSRSELGGTKIPGFYSVVADRFANIVPGIQLKMVYAGCFGEVTEKDWKIYNDRSRSANDSRFRAMSEWIDLVKYFPEKFADEFKRLGMNDLNYDIDYALSTEVIEHCIPSEVKSLNRSDLHAGQNADFIIDGTLIPIGSDETRISATVTSTYRVEPYIEPPFNEASRTPKGLGRILSGRIFGNWPKIVDPGLSTGESG